MGAIDSPSTTLADTDRRLLLHVARSAIQRFLSGRPHAIPRGGGELSRRGAAFVTLRRRDTGGLRGCRGEYRARRPLIEAVARTAIASATDDPRFPPLGLAELAEISIEISRLTPPAPIAPDAIELGRHGLLLRRGSVAGLLLPQVAVDQAWTRDQYLHWLCRKAELPDGAWLEPGTELLGFEAEVWGEP